MLFQIETEDDIRTHNLRMDITRRANRYFTTIAGMMNGTKTENQCTWDPDCLQEMADQR